MPDLTSFLELVNVAGEKTVKLSGGSLTVLLSALDLINDPSQWHGTAEDFTLTDTERDTVEGYIDAAIYEVLRSVSVSSKEIGEPFALFVDDVPAGSIPMDGSSRLQSQYPALMTKIPESWKDGEFFTLPNMVARGLFGAGEVQEFSQSAGSVFGERKHQLTGVEMPAHTHQMSKKYDPAPRANNRISWSLGTTAQDEYEDQQTQLNGGSQAHNNLPPGLAVFWFIQAE